MLSGELSRYQKLGYTVLIMAQSEKRMRDIQRTFREYSLLQPLEASEELQKEQKLESCPILCKVALSG